MWPGQKLAIKMIPQGNSNEPDSNLYAPVYNVGASDAYSNANYPESKTHQWNESLRNIYQCERQTRHNG